MTPSLFDLPLRLGDAAALAAVLLDVLGEADGKVTDDQRQRAGARAASIELRQLRPYFGSIERDPVHPAACYVCVDGIEKQPLLLRVATASTPSSGMFPKAILIGRTHAKHRELVLNAVPFGPADHDRITVFSEQINKAFTPKPAGTRSVVRVASDAPAQTFPLAFDAFRKILRSTGQNKAAFALAEGQNPEEFYSAAVWSAIRAGWREGYALQGPVARRGFEPALPNATHDVYLTAGMTEESILALLQNRPGLQHRHCTP